MSHEVERDDDDKDIAEKDRSYLLSYTRHLERKIRTLSSLIFFIFFCIKLYFILRINT